MATSRSKSQTRSAPGVKTQAFASSSSLCHSSRSNWSNGSCILEDLCCTFLAMHCMSSGFLRHSIYIYTHIYIYLFIYTHIHTYIHTYIHLLLTFIVICLFLAQSFRGMPKLTTTPARPLTTHPLAITEESSGLRVWGLGECP